MRLNKKKLLIYSIGGALIMLLLCLTIPYIIWGRIIFFQFTLTESIQDAKNRNLFIEKKMQIDIKGDSLIKNKCFFDIWQSKHIIRKQLGWFPFIWNEEYKEYCYLNIQSKKDFDWIAHVSKNTEYHDFTTGINEIYKSKHDTAIIYFYYNKETNYIPIGEISIKW